MRLFFNYFVKTLAFLAATTVFLVILGYLITFIQKNDELVKVKSFVLKEGNQNSNNKIAVIRLKGPILQEPSELIEFKFIDSINAIYVSELEKDLENLKFENPKGLIISIDSPGGSVTASYNFFKVLENFKKNNEIMIFSHSNEILASGGYWAILPSDKIYANYGSIVGSIGVRGPDWTYYDNPISISRGIFGESIETKNGIKNYNTIAGKSKDLLNPFRMPSGEEREVFQNIVNSVYSDFVNAVSRNRSIEKKFIISKLGALVFDSKKAKEYYLIDDVKNLNEVKKIMIKELKLNDYQIIEKKFKKNFFNDLIKLSLLSNYDLNKIIDNKICKLSNNYLNVILTNLSIHNC